MHDVETTLTTKARIAMGEVDPNESKSGINKSRAIDPWTRPEVDDGRAPFGPQQLDKGRLPLKSNVVPKLCAQSSASFLFIERTEVLFSRIQHPLTHQQRLPRS